MGLGQRVCESRFHLLTPDNTQNISGSRKNLRVGDLVYLRPGFGILGENGVGGGGGGGGGGEVRDKYHEWETGFVRFYEAGLDLPAGF